MYYQDQNYHPLNLQIPKCAMRSECEYDNFKLRITVAFVATLPQSRQVHVFSYEHGISMKPIYIHNFFGLKA